MTLPKRYKASDRLRLCSECGEGVSSQCKTGICRRCTAGSLMSKPEIKASQSAGLREAWKDPAQRRKAAETARHRWEHLRQNPEAMARIRAGMMVARIRLVEPEIKAKAAAARRASPKTRAGALASWCPEHKRDEYQRLIHRKKIRAAEAKQIILDSLTPFERQMHAVRQGRGLVQTYKAPRGDYAFTLGGVTPL